MGHCVTEEQAITRAQYLDLFYLQSNMLYDMLPNAPSPSSNLTALKSPTTPPIDGVIGSVSQTPMKSSSKEEGGIKHWFQ